MELKRLLARATALLLQGAYQGAESFIEQAMAEADNLKSELAEIDTLRTRVTEMAAEVERLQSVIDEANAQEPFRWFLADRVNQSEDMLTEVTGNIDPAREVLMPMYLRPIPAQQSFEQALRLLAYSRENYEKHFGFSSDADWVYKDLAELFIVDLPVQQSLGVAVPDLNRIADILEKLVDFTPKDYEDQVKDITEAEDLIEKLRAGIIAQSPRITEQDAHPEVSYPSGKGVLLVPVPDVNDVVIVRDQCGDYRRVADKAITKINEANNEKAN